MTAEPAGHCTQRWPGAAVEPAAQGSQDAAGGERPCWFIGQSAQLPLTPSCTDPHGWQSADGGMVPLDPSAQVVQAPPVWEKSVAAHEAHAADGGSVEVEPGGQAPQTERPAWAWKPTGQFSHAFGPVRRKRPAGHAAQEPEGSGSVACWPLAHRLQAEAPAGEKCAGPHCAHVSESGARNFPATHAAQVDEGGEVATWPAAQSAQTEAPALLYVLAGHDWHTAARAIAKLPPAQFWHAAEPDARNLPAVHATHVADGGVVASVALAQLVQAAAPAAENWPPAHAVQAAPPAARNLPAAQATQLAVGGEGDT